MLYTAHQHLKVEELRRCIVNQTFETLMKKDKQMTTALREQYPGAEFMLKKLEIPITGNFGKVKLYVYPASGNAMLFEEEDVVDYGESKCQLQEGCTYEYELVAKDGRTYQFMKEDEIVRLSLTRVHREYSSELDIPLA